MNLKDILAISKPNKKTLGVYILLKNDEIVYVGQSENIEARIITHRDKSFTDFAIIECNSRKEAVKLEIDLIRKFEPQYNTLFNPSALREIHASRFLNGKLLTRNGTWCAGR